MTLRHSAALILSALAASAATAASTLPLYVGQPLAGAKVLYGDFDVQKTLDGDNGRMDDDPKLKNAVVEARRTNKDAAGDALGLAWKDAWFSTLRVESAPLDLRPYLARGTVSFDLKVNELAKGGLNFRIDCGNNCERKVPDVIPARAAEGKGWQHRSYALSCFYRKGDDFSAVTKPFALDGTGAGNVEIANIRIDMAGKPNQACPDYRTASVTPSPLNESWSLDWWMPRHEEKLAEIARRKAAGERTELVFIGDSITHHWEKEQPELFKTFYGRYSALDLGYGGDRTENVLWRLQHGEIDGIAPKVAVLMIGTNNTGFRQEAPELIYAGIKRDIAEIRKRLPKTKLLLLAIFPRGEKPDDTLRVLNEKVNAMLPRLADNKHVFFLNMNKAFLAADGTLSKDIMPDLLHPNAEGYKIWQREMQPELDRLMR
ncbi:putative glycoside hydrolase [Telluria mixta]|uniref:Glycoside hydrolase n=1 Tax=Telluria mixta TaxID=34071 RepID=A0ABT2C8M1_9BURK|nr:GDSL-type esterase/lipase family protein [Telluria mixta]MCS0633770.1 putative glycoside hydrolase [Telluria mixta]WEM95082.1 putative glycoside hydrolase [Telluria mixta]